MVGRAGTGLIPLPAASAGRWMRSTGGICVRGRGCPRSALSPPRSGCPAGPWWPASSTPSRPGCCAAARARGPRWPAVLRGPPAASSIAILLLRRMAADRETIDLPVSPQ